MRRLLSILVVVLGVASLGVAAVQPLSLVADRARTRERLAQWLADESTAGTLTLSDDQSRQDASFRAASAVGDPLRDDRNLVGAFMAILGISLIIIGILLVRCRNAASAAVA